MESLKLLKHIQYFGYGQGEERLNIIRKRTDIALKVQPCYYPLHIVHVFSQYTIGLHVCFQPPAYFNPRSWRTAYLSIF